MLTERTAVDLLTHWLLLTWILNENKVVPRSSSPPTNGQTRRLSRGHLISIACEIEKLHRCLWNGSGWPRAMLQLPLRITDLTVGSAVTQLISIESAATRVTKHNEAKSPEQTHNLPAITRTQNRAAFWNLIPNRLQLAARKFGVYLMKSSANYMQDMTSREEWREHL